MKISRGIKLALGVALLGYVAYDLPSDIAQAYGYWSTNIFLSLAILIVAPLLGIALLAYRDKVTDKAKTLHAFSAFIILAIVVTASSTALLHTIWSGVDFSAATPKQIGLYALTPLVFYGIAAGLWWQSIVLWKKHRTIGSRVPSTRCRVP